MEVDGTLNNIGGLRSVFSNPDGITFEKDGAKEVVLVVLSLNALRRRVVSIG